MPAMAPRVVGQGQEENQCPRRLIGRWRVPVSACVRPELLAQRQAGSRTPPSLADLPPSCPPHRRCPSCPTRKCQRSCLGTPAAGLLQGHSHGRAPRAGDSVPFKTQSQKEALPGHACAKRLRCSCWGGGGNSFSSAPRTGMAFTC